MKFTIEHGVTFQDRQGARYSFGDVSLFAQKHPGGKADFVALLREEDTPMVTVDITQNHTLVGAMPEKSPLVLVRSGYNKDGWDFALIHLGIAQDPSNRELGVVGYVVDRQGKIEKSVVPVSADPVIVGYLDREYQFLHQEEREGGVWVMHHTIVNSRGTEFLSVSCKDGVVSVSFQNETEAQMSFPKGNTYVHHIAEILKSPLDMGAAEEVAGHMELLWSRVFTD